MRAVLWFSYLLAAVTAFAQSQSMSDEMLLAHNSIRRSLAKVRHDRGRKAGKSFRISSGNRRVYTTFAIEFEPFGEAEPELL
jgi:hypothetical protein